jgi:hypothetical protein
MKSFISRMLPAFLLCTSAVLAVEVKSDYDRAYMLDKLYSFHFADPPQRSGKDALASDELVAKRIQNALKKNLLAAGFAQTATPDFSVNYYLVVRNQARVETFGRPRLGLGSIHVDNYTEGTAIVEFRDAKAGELVWRGVLTGAVDPNKSEEKINQGMKKLVERFIKDRERQKRAAR